MIDKLS